MNIRWQLVRDTGTVDEVVHIAFAGVDNARWKSVIWYEPVILRTPFHMKSKEVGIGHERSYLKIYRMLRVIILFLSAWTADKVPNNLQFEFCTTYSSGFDIGAIMPCLSNILGFVASWNVSFVVHSGPIGIRKDLSYCIFDSN